MSTPICECLFSVANRIRNNKRNNGNDNDKNSNNNTHDELNNIINSTPEDPCDAIFQLKKLILTKGLPRDISNEMRSKTWKLLLGIPYFDVDEYLNKGKVEKII